jgi:hypothetical protein
MHAMMARRRTLPLLALFGFVLACDKEPAKDHAAEAGAATTASAPVASHAPTPEPPRAPQIIVDAAATAIGPDRVMANDTDSVAKMAALLTGKPKVEGEVVDVTVMRKAKPSHVAALVKALTKAKAKGASVHTETRDKGTGTLALTFPKAAPPPCSVVAYIGKDGGINVWPVSGATAKKFNRGFAGPDMTLGPEGVRKAASTCDSPMWLVSADDTLDWGLLYDLATIAKGEGADTLRPTQTVLLTEAPVPGRKVTIEAE